MKGILLTFFLALPLFVFGQSSFKVTYDFDTDMGATVTGAGSVSAGNAVAAGTKLTGIGVVDDNGTSAYQAHVVNNNSTNYNFTNLRFDLTPNLGTIVKIDKITVTHRSSIPGVEGASQTYLYRIGCAMNGAKPVNTNADQSTGNLLFYDTHQSEFFNPGASVNTASGDDYLSVWLTARGKSTSNDEFDWFVDKVEVEGTVVQVLALPSFDIEYSFDGGSLSPVVSGTTFLSASDMGFNGPQSSVEVSGVNWVKTNSNSNNIGYKNIGFLFDITPDAGYEVVLNDYKLVHAGSGVEEASRVNRVAVYRDASRANAGILVRKQSYTSYCGAGVYGDAVSPEKFKTSTFEDDFSFDAQHFFTYSVNRIGSPATAEYMTLDQTNISGWVIPVGRKDLLSVIVEGQDLLFFAKIGDAPSEYPESAYNALQAALVDATDVLNDINSTGTEIDNAKQDVDAANALFLESVITLVATITVNEDNGHELIEGMSGYNSRLADSGWSFKNPQWQDAMKDLNAGWLRYMTGTRNNAFNMNIGLYEKEDLDQLIEHGSPAASNVTCHKRVEVKGPQTVYDLYQGLGNTNSRLVVTWSGFIGEPWEAALFAQFCKDNHIEVDLWQFVNEPYFHIPGRGSYFWNDGADFARKMHPIADSIKAYLPDAILAPNASWDNADSEFSRGIANYEPRFYNAFSKHTYAAYNTNTSTPLDQAVKELVGGVYYAGTESFPSITDTYGADIPVYITESGTWNTVSSSIIMSGIYMSEYILRMATHTNTKLVAKHSLNSAASPINNHSSLLDDAYKNNTVVPNVDALDCGYSLTVEGKGQRIINGGINHSDYMWETIITGDVMVDADNKKTDITQVPALFGGLFDGTNGKKYLLITNKSGVEHEIVVEGYTLPANVDVTYISSLEATTANADITEQTKTVASSELTVGPYSVTRIEWLDAAVAPSASRIYDVKINLGEVALKWWTKDNADSYVVSYGTDPQNLSQSLEFAGNTTNTGIIPGLTDGETYYFAVAGKNSVGVGANSKVVDAKLALPGAPVLASAYGRTDSRLDGIITMLWRSVPFAHGYKVEYGTVSGDYTMSVDAGNCSGFRLAGLTADTEYFVRVVAYNGFGESVGSQEMAVTVIDERPVSPHQVHVSENTSNGELTIQWENSLDFNYGATFNIYRSTKPYTDYQLVASDVSGSSYTHVPGVPAGEYFYTVKAQNSKGESYYPSNKSTIQVTFSTGMGNDGEAKFGYDVKIYPVPATEELNVSIAQYNKSIAYQLVNLMGTTVAEGNFVQSGKIDLSLLSSGIYILKLKTEEGDFQSKILKK